MKVLVIGASGLVGGNIVECLREDTNYEVLGTYRSFPVEECEFFDPFVSESFDVVEKFKPQVIIHTGGWTYVDGCEQDPNKSYRENVEATEVIISLAKKLEAKMIYTSTDYVFDGSSGPYQEEDQVNPINVYGKHKLESEKLIKAKLENYLILRITNVYGDEIRNKNFVARILKDLAVNDNISITAPFDQYATPINALDIARAIGFLLRDNKVGVYHLGSTDYLSRVQLIQLLQRYFPKKNIGIIAKSTKEIQPPALRPLCGGLISMKFLGEYPFFTFSNLDQYFQKILKR